MKKCVIVHYGIHEDLVSFTGRVISNNSFSPAIDGFHRSDRCEGFNCIHNEETSFYSKLFCKKKQSVNRPVSDSAEVDCASNNVSSGVANTRTVDPAPVAEDFNQVRKISMILETTVKAIPFVR
ncbi:hypothetical protein AVEN_209877-1 [Araneus ventricosus]|uniref:Uncharacterized protein n=1 Tax=Araneus ventricosus TaxID=182803 RepID=A0A4Y2JRU9_ARAVE|nr:hypothetical protein AVEN_209877-1 [Araneus ventricosus]